MTTYFIQAEGRQIGPFFWEELIRQPIRPDTLIRVGDGPVPVPASSIPELREHLKGAAAPDLGGTPAASQSPGQAFAGKRSARASIVFIILGLTLVFAAAAYLLTRGKGDNADQKDEIAVIHEREVEKAKQELIAEKQAKKDAALRAQALEEQKAERLRLQAELRKVAKNKAHALSEMDRIRRPKIFRSRSKKEAQLAEQLRIIDQLDARAASLNADLARCNAAIDSLSNASAP